MLRLLVLALLAVVPLAGCGGNDDDGAARDPDRVQGTGYSLSTPDGWEDRSHEAGEFAANGVEPDVILTGEVEDGFAVNINVLRQDGLPEGMDVEAFTGESHDALTEATDELASALSPREISAVRELELDGEPARTFDYSGTSHGVELRFRQVYAVRDGVGYVVTYTDRRNGFERDTAVVDDVLASWRWE